MPRKTKDEEVKKVTKRSKKADSIEVEKKSTSIKNTQKASKSSTSKAEKKVATSKVATKKATSKKATTKKAVAKKETSSKAKSSATQKSSTTSSKTAPKKSSTTAKRATTKKETATKTKVATTKSSTSKATAKKTTKTATKKTTTRRTTTKKAKPITTEYYDLPAAYNRTIVKILAQTPSSLFVYWEISEDDKKNLQKQYGEEFFQNTKPYLIITNETMNYSFEIEINDYANSWYIHIHDSSCHYGVQLIRKPIHHNASTSNSSIHIISSNEITIPNDHILFDKLGKTVFFRDVKSNREIEKDISSLSFISNIGRVYNIYDLYKEIYKNELNGDELGMGLSSSGFSSTFI